MSEEPEVGSIGHLEGLPEVVVAPGNMVDAGGGLRRGSRRPIGPGKIYRNSPSVRIDSAQVELDYGRVVAQPDGNSRHLLPSEWDVPKPPLKNARQLIYLFIGMEPARNRPCKPFFNPSSRGQDSRFLECRMSASTRHQRSTQRVKARSR